MCRLQPANATSRKKFTTKNTKNTKKTDNTDKAQVSIRAGKKREEGAGAAFSGSKSATALGDRCQRQHARPAEGTRRQGFG